MSHALDMDRGTVAEVLPDIIERHAGEAAFLWHLRDRAVRSHTYDLVAHEALDERVEAHLSGLRIAGDIAWEICRAELADGDAGEVFAATVLAVDRADAAGLAEVVAHGVRSPLLARGVVSALGWTPLGRARRFLDELLADDAPPELHYFGIAGAAAHRHDPGASLARAIDADDARLRARALRAAGELGRADLLPALRRQLGSEDAACRFWAAWSGALLGERAAVDILRRIALAGGPFIEQACSMVMRIVDPAVGRAMVLELAARSGLLRAALAGAAALGDPGLVPFLLECMVQPDQARFAGWAFAQITGVDLAEQRLSGRTSPGYHAGPTDDPHDPNVALDPDERLPWPDIAALRAWWERRRAALPPTRRMLRGRAIEPTWLWNVLGTGGQSARAAAAIELALIQPDRPLFEVRAPGLRQRRALQEPRRGG